MAYPHVIRLRGPWECDRAIAQMALSDGTLTESARDVSEFARLKAPADWAETLGPEFRGRVSYTRRFNRPTNLEPHDRVWLMAEGVDARGNVTIDSRHLGAIDGYALAAEWDVTHLLQASSVLSVDIELPPTGAGQPPPVRPGRELLAGGLIGEVRLEIRRELYVAGLSVYWQPGRAPQWHISGRVEGPASNDSLHLIATACDREVAYARVTAGAPFTLCSTIDDWPAWPDPMDEPVLTPVEIRLSDGRSTLWQTTLETAPPQPDAERTRATMLRSLSGEMTLSWLDYVDRASDPFQQALSQPGTVLGLRGILPDAAYHELDRANVGVVQQVPRAWAERVCPRLAHHPCILAWALPPGEDQGVDSRSTPAWAFGRPWLPAVAS
ncbi:MAG TPA: hypothetical protein VHD36_23665 [Pirellulales bacterium]|nr:hypothetical protein [Pirellulales bacterium]